MPLCLQPPPKGCNCFLWFSSFLQTRWRGLSHFLAANQRDLVIVWGGGKCVLAELVAKKKKPSQLYSAFARIVPLCMCDSREELFGNKAPRRQTTPWAQGMKREWDECFFKLLSPQNIFPTYHFVFCNISPDARESSTWNKLSLWMLHIYEIFTFGF